MIRTLLISILLAGCGWSRPSLTPKVVIDANGKTMTAQAFAQELAYRLKDQDALSAKDPKLVALTKAKVAEDFIVQNLTEDWARENNLLVRAEDLEKQIQSVQKSYPDDLAFQQALAEEGTTFKAWKDRLQQTLLQKMVAKKLAESLAPPTEAEAQAYYQQHKSQFSMRETAQVRQILLATETDAKTVEEQLKKGKRMADLAKKYSISPEASEGGMVGWLEKGLSDVFEPAFRMKQGARSPIVRSPFGYHIFEVTGRKPAHNKAFPEVKAEIKRILMEKREQSAYLSWLEQQVRKARVFKDQDFIDAIKVETKIQ